MSYAPANEGFTPRSWENVDLPLHLSMLRRFLSSTAGIIFLFTIHMIGIVNAAVSTYSLVVLEGVVISNRFNGNKGLEILTYVWICLNFLLCPLAIFYCQRILMNGQVQQLLYDVSLMSPHSITGIEFLAHQNLSITFIALLLYIVFIGTHYAITFAACTCLPLYIAVTVAMLELESLRQHSQNFVAHLGIGTCYVQLAELRDDYMKVWKTYASTSERDSNFFIFLIVYVFTCLFLCMWWAYTVASDNFGLLGFIFALFIYFVQVFLFIARANEMGLSMAAAVAEYFLHQGNNRQRDFASYEELNLFVSCVNLARPEVSLHGFVLRYRGAAMVTGGMIIGIIPRLFLSKILSNNNDHDDTMA